MLSLRKELEESLKQRRAALEMERKKIDARLDELEAMGQEALRVVDFVEKQNASVKSVKEASDAT